MDNLVEGERCHLECRLEPINDPNLKVEWFVNGVEIKAGESTRLSCSDVCGKLKNLLKG